MNIKPFNKEDIDIAEWEFEFQQRSEQPILLSDWYCQGIWNYFPTAFNLDILPFDYLFTGSSKGYIKTIQKKDLLEKLRVALEDESYVNYVLTNSFKVMEDFSRAADEIQATLTPATTNEELRILWEKMREASIKPIPWFWIPYYPSAENIITDKIKIGLSKHKEAIEKITDLNDALLSLVFPVKLAAFQQEQIDFAELLKRAQTMSNFETDSSFIKEMEKYIHNYSWSTTFPFMPTPPMGMIQLIERIHTGLRNNSIEDFTLQQLAKEKTHAKAEQILAILVEDFELTKTIMQAREFAYTLTGSIEEALRAAIKYIPLQKLVAERIGISLEKLRFLTFVEVSAALSGQPLPPQFESRKDSYVMAVLGGEIHVAYGMEGKQLTKWVDSSLAHKVDKTLTELKGQVACKGHVQGKVRIALTPTDSHILMEGEILVCPMTNPDYVPAMKRSAAIITDEGGLLSHAAIMSREFNKPCVIATKIATQLLKDGDMVEVDANTGIIRILS